MGRDRYGAGAFTSRVPSTLKLYVTDDRSQIIFPSFVHKLRWHTMYGKCLRTRSHSGRGLGTIPSPLLLRSILTVRTM